MLKIWILDEEFIAGSFVGYGEKKTRAVTCTFQTKLSDTQTGPHSFEGAKKMGNVKTISLSR